MAEHPVDTVWKEGCQSSPFRLFWLCRRRRLRLLLMPLAVRWIPVSQVTLSLHLMPENHNYHILIRAFRKIVPAWRVSNDTCLPSSELSAQSRTLTIGWFSFGKWQHDNVSQQRAGEFIVEPDEFCLSLHTACRAEEWTTIEPKQLQRRMEKEWVGYRWCFGLFQTVSDRLLVSFLPCCLVILSCPDCWLLMMVFIHSLE